MPIFVAGVRHKNAPIEVREQFALAEADIEMATRYFKSAAGVSECVLLTTCNRTELYLSVQDAEAGLEAVRQFYLDVRQLDITPYRHKMFTLLNEDAALHLFRVASGMDSLILGEGQILAQVKDALATAQKHHTLGLLLDKLFKTAIFVGKRVRTETGIASQDASVSRAAYEFAKHAMPDLLDRRIALVGGGKMAEIIMSALKHDMSASQQLKVSVINRSPNRLKSLTEKFGFAGLPWEQLQDGIDQAEVLFVATGAPHVVFGPSYFQHLDNKLIIDISVPRNVDPQVGELPGIRLVNTDDLSAYSGLSFERQQGLLSQAQMIIEEEYTAFQQWMMALPARQTISQLCAKLETIRRQELSRQELVATGVAASTSSPELMDALSRNLVNKILHDPLVGLKSSSNVHEINQHMAALSRLFRLAESVESLSSSSQQQRQA